MGGSEGRQQKLAVQARTGMQQISIDALGAGAAEGGVSMRVCVCSTAQPLDRTHRRVGLQLSSEPSLTGR